MSPALDVGASQSLDRESPQRSSPTLPIPMRRAADGVGMGKAVWAHVYRRWLTKESRKSWACVTQPRRRSHRHEGGMWHGCVGILHPAETLTKYRSTSCP